MISNRVKNLFAFIDYLHSKIEHYQSFGGLFSELESLGNKRRNLIPNNYFDKKKLDEINSEIKNKFEVINSEIIQPIKQKATELNICNPEKIETLWNNNISEIENLHNEVNENEVKHIVNQKDKYLHFRLNAPGNLFTQNDFAPEFFDELDKILKELFKDFDEYKKNEFDSLPPNSVEVNLTTFFLKDLKNLEVKTPKQPEKLKPELKIPQIALKCLYSGIHVTRANAQEIIEKYGWKSGAKLYNEYTHYSSYANRKGKPHPFTRLKLENKIKLLESVVELVPKEKRNRIKDEIKKLKNFRTEFK
tara:strand:+ start:1792 stop:2706 length:915 start_codon:yes stop_codon:yes gene_type:complete